MSNMAVVLDLILLCKRCFTSKREHHLKKKVTEVANLVSLKDRLSASIYMYKPFNDLIDNLVIMF